MKVEILLYESSDRKTDYLIELVHRLGAAGHEASYAPKTMHDFGMDVKRISGFVERTEADAWVVVAGSRDLFEWFIGRGFRHSRYSSVIGNWTSLEPE